MLYPKYDEDRRRPEAPEIAAYFDVVAYVEASAGIRWLRTGTGTVYLPLGEAVPEGGGAKVHRWAEVVYDLTNLAIGYLHEGTSVQRIALQPSLPAAIEEASAFLHKSGDPGLILADADAAWRLEPSTRFQQDWLAELLRPPANQYTVLTRGAASDAIGILEWAERTKKANIDSRAA